MIIIFLLSLYFIKYLAKEGENNYKYLHIALATMVLARKTVDLIAKNANEPILEMLVEDGCFEEKIP